MYAYSQYGGYNKNGDGGGSMSIDLSYHYSRNQWWIGHILYGVHMQCFGLSCDGGTRVGIFVSANTDESVLGHAIIGDTKVE